MHHFSYKEGVLHAEDVALDRLAKEVGTPAYIYSRATFERHFRVVDGALGAHPHLVCYSVKANSNLAVLALLARLGSGFDIVSGGELHRVVHAGGDPRRTVFSGVGKTAAEMRAALEAGIRCFNVESEAELEVLEGVAESLGTVAPVAIRVNPDVDPKTHPYIATGLKEHKFGVPMAAAPALYERAAKSPHLDPVGVDCHIGSQITDLGPVVDAADRIRELVEALRADGLSIRHVDLGGGMGIPYDEEQPPHPDAWGDAMREVFGRLPDLELVVEPGRVIAGNAGLLLTRVLYVKETLEKTFVITDAGMNDLLRPALYGAYHEIRPVREPPESAEVGVVDVVGPICESSDVLGRDRSLPGLRPGDLLAVMSAGAYGFVMSNNYNSRPRPPEILVDGAAFRVVRARERIDDLVRGENVWTED